MRLGFVIALVLASCARDRAGAREAPGAAAPGADAAGALESSTGAVAAPSTVAVVPCGPSPTLPPDGLSDVTLSGTWADVGGRVSWSPDGALVALGSDTGRLLVYDVRDHAPRAVGSLGLRGPMRLGIELGGSGAQPVLLASTYDLDHKTTEAILLDPSSLCAAHRWSRTSDWVTWTQDSPPRLLFVSPDRLEQVDPGTGQTIALTKLDPSMTFCQPGRAAAICHDISGQRARLFDASSGAVLAEWSDAKDVSWSWSRDKTTLVIVRDDARELIVWKAGSATHTWPIGADTVTRAHDRMVWGARGEIGIGSPPGYRPSCDQATAADRLACVRRNVVQDDGVEATFDLTTGRLTSPAPGDFRRGDATPVRLVETPGGPWFAEPSADRFWPLVQEKPADPYEAIEISDDDRFLIIPEETESIVWNLRDLSVLRVDRLVEPISRTGALKIRDGSGSVRFLDDAGKLIVGCVREDGCVASPDGQLVAVNGMPANVRESPSTPEITIWSAQTKDLARRIPLKGDDYAWPLWSPDGATLGVVGPSSLDSYDARTGQRRGSIALSRERTSLSDIAYVDPSTAMIVNGNAPDIVVRRGGCFADDYRARDVYDVSGQRVLRTDPVLRFSPDRKRVLTGSPTGVVRVVDLGQRRALAPVCPGRRVAAFAWLPGGAARAVCIAASGTGTSGAVWDPMTGREVGRLQEVERLVADASPGMLARPSPMVVFAPDGAGLAVMAGDHVRVWRGTGDPAWTRADLALAEPESSFVDHTLVWSRDALFDLARHTTTRATSFVQRWGTADAFASSSRWEVWPGARRPHSDVQDFDPQEPQRVIVLTPDGGGDLWDLGEDRKLGHVAPLVEGDAHITVSRDGRFAAVENLGVLRVLRVADGAMLTLEERVVPGLRAGVPPGQPCWSGLRDCVRAWGDATEPLAVSSTGLFDGGDGAIATMQFRKGKGPGGGEVVSGTQVSAARRRRGLAAAFLAGQALGGP